MAVLIEWRERKVPQRRKSSPNPRAKGGLTRWFKEIGLMLKLVNLVVVQKERKEATLLVDQVNVSQVRHLRQ